MITEIILAILAIDYYLFSVFFFATVIYDKDKRHTGLQILEMVLIVLTIAPIATPIILGIEKAEKAIK